MLNPDPEKFYPLSEAFNVLGRSRFGDKWTGAELATRDLPPPKHTFQALKDAVEARARAHLERDRERREKIKRAKKAASAVKSGPSISRRPRSPVQPAAPEAVERRRIEEIAKIAGLEPETVKAVNDQRAYRKEYKARARRDKAENELRKVLHGKRIPATLLNNHDGKLVDIPPAYWLADKFTVDFASGQAEWADLEEGRRITYQGVVLIDRRDLDRAVTGPQQLTANAESKCIEWAHGLPSDPVWRKLDFITEALKRFPGLSKLGAMRVWAAEAPDNWKRPGPKS